MRSMEQKKQLYANPLIQLVFGGNSVLKNHSALAWHHKSSSIQCRLDYWLVSKTKLVAVIKQTLVHLFGECQDVETVWNSFVSWWNSCNAPRVNLTVTDKIYAHHPEKTFFSRSFCLIVARFYIYTASMENEPLSFLAFKIRLKSKLSKEPSYVQGSVCLK